jgi:hypothetical protein
LGVGTKRKKKKEKFPVDKESSDQFDREFYGASGFSPVWMVNKTKEMDEDFLFTLFLFFLFLSLCVWMDHNVLGIEEAVVLAETHTHMGLEREFDPSRRISQAGSRIESERAISD